jgi:hypothetical protein
MRRLLIVLALAGSAACSDTHDPMSPATPALTPATAQAASSAAPRDTTPADATPAELPTDAVTDAVDRVGPTLGDSEEAAAVRAQLRALLEPAARGGRGLAGDAALPAVAAALDRLERADPELAPEIDAIRLALAPLLDAARMHKPF